MEAHLDHPLTLEDIADHAGLTVRGLTRCFRAETGLPPLQHLLRARIQLAQRLLERGDEPVERIAARTGLGTPANLRHHFQHHTGTSPRTYRTAFRSLVSTLTWADGLPIDAPASREQVGDPRSGNERPGVRKRTAGRQHGRCRSRPKRRDRHRPGRGASGFALWKSDSRPGVAGIRNRTAGGYFHPATRPSTRHRISMSLTFGAPGATATHRAPPYPRGRRPSITRRKRCSRRSARLGA